MTTIQKVHAREILDSRGNPTIECEIMLDNGVKAYSSVPSGASTGVHEAHELRDGEERLNGKGVQNAIKNILEIIAPAIIGMDPQNQSEIDTKMIDLDGTENKSKLGANAILAVSMCIARLGAISSGKKLYQHISKLSGQEAGMVRPFFNVINGGMHASNALPFQEFMISPNLGSFNENYFAAAEIYAQLKKNLKKVYGGSATLLGDEGGFAPSGIEDICEVLSVLATAICDTGYKGKVDIALDIAASEFYQTEISEYEINYLKEKIKNNPSVCRDLCDPNEGETAMYCNLGFKTEKDNFRTTQEMIELYIDICKQYPIISIEDPFNEDDFEAFAVLKGIFSEEKDNQVQVVGDDLTVTNPKRIQRAIDTKSCNALLLKINQIGTITEAIEAARLAKSDNWNIMVSHRSGETTDDFIADFAVGIGAEQVKFGSVARGERVCKYNRLLAISEEI